MDATEVLVDYTHPCATKKDNFILALDNSYDPIFFDASCIESTLPNDFYYIKITKKDKILCIAGFENKIISLTATEMKVLNLNTEFIFVLKKI